MIVPLEVCPLPEVDDQAGAERMIDQMFADNLPAFAIREAWSTGKEAIEALRPKFEEHELHTDTVGSVISHLPMPAWRSMLPTSIGELGRGNTRYVAELTEGIRHVDQPPIPGKPVQRLNIHTTEIGRVAADFIEPTVHGISALERQRTWFERRLSVLHLPVRLQAAINQGEVDNEWLLPVMYSVVAEPATTIVFRSEGQQPIIHSFSTLELPRVSALYRAHCME